MDEQSFLSMLEILYRAPLETGTWAVFITEFSKIVNADGGQYCLFDRLLPGIIFSIASSNYSLELQARQIEHWHAKDEIFKRWLIGGEWLVKGCEFGKHPVQMDPFHNEFLFEDITYRVAGFRMAGNDTIYPTLGFLWEKDKGSIGDTELAYLKRIRPHFDNASRLHCEMLLLKLSADMQKQAMDHLDYPILLVYENSFIAFLNRAAEQWLTANTAIGIKEQRLTGLDKVIQAELERLLSNAHRRRISGACALPRPGGGHYQMIVQPLSLLSQLGSLWRRSIAMIVIADPLAKRCLPAEWLRALFGLTTAEAQLAMALGEGKTLEEIAAQARITIHTARSHLKQALHKTGTRRQGELIKLITTLPQIKTDINPPEDDKGSGSDGRV